MRRFALAALATAMMLVSVAAPATAQAGTKQRFKIVFVNTQDEARIVGAGPISGAGTVYFLSAEEGPDGSFVETYRAEFPSGSVIVTATGANESFHFDPRSCVLRMTNSGTFTVSDGTGAYEGLGGEGTFTFRLTEVARQGPEGCSEESHGVGVASLVGSVA